MPSAGTLSLFVPVALAFLAVPGPAVLFVVARSVEHGRAAGLVSMLGLETGALVHVAAAAGGASAVLASSTPAFEGVRYAGAAYLLVLGIRRLRARDVATTDSPLPGQANLRRMFGQGVLVDVLNPKTALFFLALLPQFVRPGHGDPWLQMALLGLVFVGLAVVVDGAYALAAAGARGWLRRSAGFRRAERTVVGGVYVSLGLVAAIIQ